MKKVPTYDELKIQIAELQRQNDFLVQNLKKESFNKENPYRLLFENSIDGFAYCKVIFENESPADFIYLEVNPAFEKLTGYKNVAGRKVTDVVPEIKEKNPELLQMFGSVAVSGEPAKFEIYFEPLKTWFEISVICPEKGFFIEIFNDISERKNTAQLIKQKSDELIAARVQAEENEEKFRLIFENTSDAILFTEPNGAVYLVNKEASKMFGYENEEFQALGRNGIIDLNDNRFENALEERRITGKFKGELNFKKKDGSVFPCDTTSNIFVNSRGSVKSSIILRDITERKQAEKALNESEAKYRLLFENMTNGFSVQKVITDENNNPIDSIFMEANRHFKDFSGYDINEIKGKSIRELHPNADLKMIQKYGNVGLTGVPFSTEYFSNTYNKYINVNCYSPENGIFATVYEDITERKKAEQTLKDREELLNTITDNVQALIAIVNKDFEYVFVNKKAEEYFGKAKSEIIGKKPIEFIGSEAYERGCSPVIKALNGETVTYENQFPDKNGVIQLMQNSVVPYFQNNEITGAIILNVNVSQIKFAELEIQQKNQELVKLNAEKDRFISILAHDLRSPFSGILGFIDLLVSDFKESDTKTIETHLSLLQKSANHAYNLLNDLLNWAIAKSSKQVFNPFQISFYEICEEMKDNVQELSSSKNIEVTNLINKESEVFGDIDMLKTIMRNLVLNAIKFTDTNGKIDISAEINDGEMLISVKDTGVGISKERLPKIFSIDEVCSTTGTKGEKGTGLGLLLCKEFVERHGGKIWVESELLKGSDFIFTLPLHLD